MRGKRGEVEFEYVIAVFIIVMLAATALPYANNVVSRSEFWQLCHLKNSGSMIMMALGANGNLEVDYQAYPHEFEFRIDRAENVWIVSTPKNENSEEGQISRKYYFADDENFDFAGGSEEFIKPVFLSFYVSDNTFSAEPGFGLVQNLGQGSFVNKKVFLTHEYIGDIQRNLDWDNFVSATKAYIGSKEMFREEEYNNELTNFADEDIGICIAIDNSKGNKVLYYNDPSGFSSYFAFLLSSDLESSFQDISAEAIDEFGGFTLFGATQGAYFSEPAKDITIVLNFNYDSQRDILDESNAYDKIIGDALYHAMENFYR